MITKVKVQTESFRDHLVSTVVNISSETYKLKIRSATDQRKLRFDTKKLTNTFMCNNFVHSVSTLLVIYPSLFPKIQAKMQP